MTKQVHIPSLLTGCMAGALVMLACVATGAPPKQVQREVSESRKPSGRIVDARVTAYCPCSVCCGKFADGKTSLGNDAYKRGVAVDPKVIPYGSTVTIPGYGVFTADDTGAAVRRGEGVRIDLRFPTHQTALEFGVKNLKVVIHD